jgi:putative transposase
MAKKTVQRTTLNIRRACEAFNISQMCYRYELKLSAENERVADWLLCLTHNQRNGGFGLCFLYLRNVKGFGWNHTRVYRIYCEPELNMRIKPKRRIVRENRSRLRNRKRLTRPGPWISCTINCEMATIIVCSM